MADRSTPKDESREQLELRSLLRLPPSLWAALVPWWGAFVLTGIHFAKGRPMLALAWAAGGLLYSTLLATVVLYRLASDSD